KLNITTSAYGYYEQGRNEPSLETLVQIAEIFHVTTDYLLGLSDKREHPVYYPLSQKISLSAEELKVVEQLKESSLLEELQEEPHRNVARLQRYWQFIVREQKQDY